MTDTPIDQARETYGIDHWSEGYVDINNQGQVLVRPDPSQAGRSVALPQLVQGLRDQGLRLPMLIRFTDILVHRANALCDAFNDASASLGYEGGYTAVYPIKVNQQRRVVETLRQAEPAASRGQMGLEAGSKPELLAVLALSTPGQSMIVCNGYKDREYVRLALIGQRMGHRVYLVVEKQSELELILEEARSLNLRPLLGVRARLATIGKGNWQNTGGEKSKFGLSAGQILTVMDQLESAGALDCLQMLHFHLGSQIANIQDIRTGLRECGRFYQELRARGAPVDTVDIGGGLGVDYDGSQSRGPCSMNYSLAEYARTVVQSLHECCSERDLPHPHIISESGRALTAHHAVLVTDVTDTESPRQDPLETMPDAAPAPLKVLEAVATELQQRRPRRSLVELYHDASHATSEMQQLFAWGNASLTERAMAERLNTRIDLALWQRLSPAKRVHRDILDDLQESLADRLFVNLSLFQSLPDVWGIEQIFPIMPLDGLDRPLSRRGLIRDITCDSDGRIDQYVDAQGMDVTLPLPEGDGKSLMLAFFLTGAYQEILGDLHNLFGDTDTVDVRVGDNGQWQAEHALRGDTVASVLRHVHFEPEQLEASLAQQLSQADLPAEEAERHRLTIRNGLAGYTYLSR